MAQHLDYEAAARRALDELKFLEPNGQIKPLDSLSMVDLVTRLEDNTGIEIPSAAIKKEAFQSIQTLAELLRDMAEGTSD